MTIKVIASDLDGTFLNDLGSYDRSRFERILAELQERDIRFVVATGNNMQRVRMIFQGLEDQLSYVAENGAYVLENNKPLVREVLDQADVKEMLAYFKGKEIAYRLSVSMASGSYLLKGVSFDGAFSMIEEEQLQLFLAQMNFIDSFANLPDEEVLKVTLVLPLDEWEAVCQDFNQAFAGRLTAVTSGYGAIDIIKTGLHKAWGLQILLDRWGISPDQVMAFGDGENDIELLNLAKYSYAMENAPDSVKSAATDLAPHHSQNGVLEVLDQLLLSE